MNAKEIISKVFSDIFLVTLLLYTSILFAELMKKGIVANYINTTYLIGIMVVSGFLSIISPAPFQQKGAWISGMVSIVIGATIGFLVYTQTASLGIWSTVFALGAAATTAACGFLVGQSAEA